jgi:hypothetical protein
MSYIICSKPFCKAPFTVVETELVLESDGNYVIPQFCPKCVAQDEMISWEDKRYEGDRWDGTPHEFSYKIKKFI